MKVLIACEFSGIVRQEFAKRGHDAWSCDLLPTEIPGQHIQGNVKDLFNNGWDLMIAHPPCTYLSNAGVGWFNVGKYGAKAVSRRLSRTLAFNFVKKLFSAPINQICIENPVGWLNTNWRKPDQIIHPYYFGDPHVKKTCLWLKNLSPLIYDKNVKKPEPIEIHYRKPSKYYQGGEIKRRYFTDTTRRGDRAKIRSKSFHGIAQAMAEQWG